MVGSVNGYGQEDSFGFPYMSAFGMGPGLSGTYAAGNAGGAEDSEGVGKVEKNPGESTIKEAGRKSSPAECETCKERKYQDGSDEMVSFKSASHISPEAAPARVRAHEEEHVSNAYKKAAEGNGKVLRASVSIHMSICPECGRSYVSGGETRTSIKYPNEENPYQKNRKALHADAFSGANVDLAV